MTSPEKEKRVEKLCLPCGGRGKRSSWINKLGREVEGRCPDCNGTGKARTP